jgi:ABC-type Fe3+-hydroxamate transport system substrate-binding protein
MPAPVFIACADSIGSARQLHATIQRMDSEIGKDALGTLHPLATAQARIISLVPSITELLLDLGLQANVVGRTGFCIHPAPLVRDIPKVGGTKDVNIEKIRALAPTHLIVNVDENELPTVQQLRTFIPHVVVTHPQTPQDNIALYHLLGGIFGRTAQAQVLASALRAQLAALSATPRPARRVLYVIWQDPWMTVARDTYISRVLALVNWHTWPDTQGGSGIAYADCVPCNAKAGATRYPTFKFSDALMREIDLVLLSTEPYSFKQQHADMLEQQIGKPVLLIDGEMISWYGSRAVAGLRYLGEFAQRL